jgi:hypothetical protein
MYPVIWARTGRILRITLSDFFHSRRDFRKNYLKTIRKKRLL